MNNNDNNDNNNGFDFISELKKLTLREWITGLSPYFPYILSAFCTIFVVTNGFGESTVWNTTHAVILGPLVLLYFIMGCIIFTNMSMCRILNRKDVTEEEFFSRCYETNDNNEEEDVDYYDKELFLRDLVKSKGFWCYYVQYRIFYVLEHIASFCYIVVCILGFLSSNFGVKTIDDIIIARVSVFTLILAIIVGFCKLFFYKILSDKEYVYYHRER